MPVVFLNTLLDIIHESDGILCLFPSIQFLQQMEVPCLQSNPSHCTTIEQLGSNPVWLPAMDAWP